MSMAGVNLLPDSVRWAELRRARTRRWTIIVVGTAAITLTAGTIDWVRQSGIATRKATFDVLLSEAETLRRDVRELVQEANVVQTRIDRANALRAKRAWSGLIAKLADRLPEGCWLTSMATDPPKPGHDAGSTRTINAKEPPKIVRIDAPQKLRLNGFADDPGKPVAFVASIKTANLFRNVNVERAQWEPNREPPCFRFEVVCEW